MDIKLIRKKLPYGGLIEISRRTKIHYVTIVDFFNGRKKFSERLETEILTATAEYLEELKPQRIKKQELLEQLKEL